MIYILVEPNIDGGWICYNGQEMAKDRCIKNGGWVMPQEDVDRIFGKYVNIVSPLNTVVSEDGRNVIFNRPSDDELKNEKSITLTLFRDVLLRKCDSYLSTTKWENMNSYQKKKWSEYRRALVEYTEREGFPWVDQNEPPFPEKPEDNATPKTIEELKEFRLDQLTEEFNDYMESPKSSILSSTGYVINANNTAKKNVDGLITVMESTGTETISFVCFDNTTAQLNLQQLRKIQLELIQYGNALYSRKWSYRSQIESAKTMDEVNSIEFNFSDVTIG